MPIRFITFIITLFLFSSLHAQINKLQANNRQGKCGQKDYCPNNTLFHETNGNISQLNYNSLKFDHIIHCGAVSMRSIDFGITYLAFPKVRATGIPFEFNQMFGMANTTIETGLGLQYLYFYGNYEKTRGKYKDDLSYLAATGRIGLRYQKDRGLFFRLGFTPILSLMNHDKVPVLGKHKFKPMAGIAIGYTFPERVSPPAVIF